jgi:hypothetical protein
MSASPPDDHTMTLVASGIDLTGHFVNHGQIKHIARVIAIQGQRGDAVFLFNEDFSHGLKMCWINEKRTDAGRLLMIA